MTAQTIATVATTGTDRPKVAHAWCTCYERDDITPIPSLCGQSQKDRTPEAMAWPEDMQACVLCAELAEADAPCPRCGATR